MSKLKERATDVLLTVGIMLVLADILWVCHVWGGTPVEARRLAPLVIDGSLVQKKLERATEAAEKFGGYLSGMARDQNHVDTVLILCEAAGAGTFYKEGDKYVCIRDGVRLWETPVGSELIWWSKQALVEELIPLQARAPRKREDRASPWVSWTPE